jgi:hypothetical protein
MGFSTPTPPQGEEVTASREPSFGQQFQNRYPVAGGLMQAVFGGDSSFSAPQASSQQSAQSDIVGMNAQPPEGGGLSAILKLLSGAG